MALDAMLSNVERQQQELRFVALPSAMRTLVTDMRAAPEFVAALRAQGVHVTVA